MPATTDLRRVACNHVRIRIIDSNVTTGHRIGLRLSSTVLVNHFLGYIIILLRGIDWMALPDLQMGTYDEELSQGGVPSIKWQK